MICKVFTVLVPARSVASRHELQMVSSAVFGELDDKAGADVCDSWQRLSPGVPLSQLVSHMLYFLRSRLGLGRRACAMQAHGRCARSREEGANSLAMPRLTRGLQT